MVTPPFIFLFLDATFTSSFMKGAYDMAISRKEKLENANKIYDMITKCNSVSDCEWVSDYLDESIQAKHIYKKAYKFLSEELDGQLSYIVEQEIRSMKNREWPTW